MQQRPAPSDNVSAQQDQGDAELWQIPEGYQAHDGNIDPIDAKKMSADPKGTRYHQERKFRRRAKDLQWERT
jgi:hypothetical protein